MAEKIMTKSEYARYRGCSKVTVSRYFASGKLGPECLTSDGRVIVEMADRHLSERIAPIQQKSSQARFSKTAQKVLSRAGIEAGPGIPLAAAQSLLVQYKTAIKKLEYEEKVGKLINADKVREAAFETARQVRDALQNIPDRIAAIVAAERDETKVRLILANEIRDALQGLVDTAKS